MTDGDGVLTDDQVTEAPPGILVADDNWQACFIMRYMLRDLGDVQTTLTPNGALERARNTPFDLVLLDITFQGTTSGVDLMEQLRAIDGYEDVPVLAVTAHALPGDRERFMAMGFDGYISKPFARLDMIETVTNQLQARSISVAA